MPKKWDNRLGQNCDIIKLILFNITYILSYTLFQLKISKIGKPKSLSHHFSSENRFWPPNYLPLRIRFPQEVPIPIVYDLFYSVNHFRFFIRFLSFISKLLTWFHLFFSLFRADIFHVKPTVFNTITFRSPSSKAFFAFDNAS